MWVCGSWQRVAACHMCYKHARCNTATYCNTLQKTAQDITAHAHLHVPHVCSIWDMEMNMDGCVCVAVCYSVLQCVAACHLWYMSDMEVDMGRCVCVAVCCSVVPCVAVCRSDAGVTYHTYISDTKVDMGRGECVAVCCSVAYITHT